MKCKECNAIFCPYRTSNAEQECVYNIPPQRWDIKSASSTKIPVGTEAAFDWDAFRREAVKDILASMVSHPRVAYGKSYVEEQVYLAIVYADELIKQLKEEQR